MQEFPYYLELALSNRLPIIADFLRPAKLPAAWEHALQEAADLFEEAEVRGEAGERNHSAGSR
jgi:hypothetical protein